MKKSGKRAAIGLAGVLGVIGAAIFVSGCNIVGPIAYLIHGPEKIPAEYELDPKHPTVIFIDDPSNQVPRRQLRATMGQTVEEILLSKDKVKADKKVNNMISSASVLAVAGKDKSESMSITQIGRAVEAEIVVWIVVDRFTLSPDGESMAPTVSIRMKIIDTVADKRLWPDDSRGKAYTFVSPSNTPMPSTSAARGQAELDLAVYAGRGISELFYDAERPTAVRAGKK